MSALPEGPVELGGRRVAQGLVRANMSAVILLRAQDRLQRRQVEFTVWAREVAPCMFLRQMASRGPGQPYPSLSTLDPYQVALLRSLGGSDSPFAPAPASTGHPPHVTPRSRR